ncbi:MAG: DUF2306 domain-containing protein [Planctomycetaceae bacterium]
MHPVGFVHVLCAVTALVLGVLIFAITKGTRLHAYLGHAYVVSMVGLNVTALLIYRLIGGFGPFHVAAFISLATLLYGYAAVWTRRPADRWLTIHYHAMSWSYVGLLAAAVSESIVRIDVMRQFISSRINFGIAVSVASGVVCIAGGWIIAKSERRVMSKLKPRGNARSDLNFQDES